MNASEQLVLNILNWFAYLSIGGGVLGLCWAFHKGVEPFLIDYELEQRRALFGTLSMPKIRQQKK